MRVTVSPRKRVQKFFLHLAIAGSVVAQTACSVGMAMSGQPEPNVSALSVGQPRSIVIMNLGSQPASTQATEEGRVDIFQLERGNAPSVGRAAGHAAMDVLTLGAWELVGTPIEGFSGEKFSITVTYDSSDNVKGVQSSPGHQTF